VGETDSPEPVTGVTGCDGLHVTGADILGGWWRPSQVEGWRSTRHRVWRPSPWSWIIQDLFLSSFSRRISPFLRMEASVAVYLKHSHTTQHNIGKTREFRPKLHTKRAEMMLCFTCYQSGFWWDASDNLASDDVSSGALSSDSFLQAHFFRRNSFRRNSFRRFKLQ